MIKRDQLGDKDPTLLEQGGGMWSESRLALGDGVGDAFQMLISQKPASHIWAACPELQ